MTGKNTQTETKSESKISSNSYRYSIFDENLFQKIRWLMLLKRTNRKHQIIFFLSRIPHLSVPILPEWNQPVKTRFSNSVLRSLTEKQPVTRPILITKNV